MGAFCIDTFLVRNNEQLSLSKQSLDLLLAHQKDIQRTLKVPGTPMLVSKSKIVGLAVQNSEQSHPLSEGKAKDSKFDKECQQDLEKIVATIDITYNYNQKKINKAA